VSESGTASESGKGRGQHHYLHYPSPAPLGLSASYSAPNALLQWSASGYTIQRSPDNLNWTTISSGSAATTYSDSLGGYGGVYYYRVRADNGSRHSDFSASVFFLPRNCLPSAAGRK
jgi:hypothetical protein